MALQKSPALRKYTLKDARLTSDKHRSFAFGTTHRARTKVGLHCTAELLYGVLLDSRPGRLAEIFDKECRVLCTLHHQNVAKFLGLMFTPDSPHPFLLSEELEDNLMDFLEKHANIELSRKLSILLSVARGLEYLHTSTPPIVHCMLTARSIGISSSQQAKITDTGISRIVDPKKFSLTVNHTPSIRVYMPPEMTPFTLEFTPEMDVFSFGHIALHTANQVFPSELLAPTHTPPNSKMLVARTELERRVHYFDLLHGYIGEGHTLTVVMKQCLYNEPQKRPSAIEVVHSLSQLYRKQEERPTTMRLPAVSKRKKLRLASVAFRKLCSKEDSLADCYKTGIPGKLELFKETGGFRKSGKWRQYTFQIIDSVLIYFKDYLEQSLAELPLRVVVEATAFCTINEPRHFPFHVRFIGKGSPWVLRASSEENRIAWMEAISPGSGGVLEMACTPEPLSPQGGRSRSFSDPYQQQLNQPSSVELSIDALNAGYVPFRDIHAPSLAVRGGLKRQRKVSEEPSTQHNGGGHYMTLMAPPPAPTATGSTLLSPPSQMEHQGEMFNSPSHATLNNLTKLLTQEEVELLINTIETAITRSEPATEQEEAAVAKHSPDGSSLGKFEYDPYVVMQSAKVPSLENDVEPPTTEQKVPYHKVPLIDLLLDPPSTEVQDKSRSSSLLVSRLHRCNALRLPSCRRGYQAKTLPKELSVSRISREILPGPLPDCSGDFEVCDVSNLVFRDPDDDSKQSSVEDRESLQHDGDKKSGQKREKVKQLCKLIKRTSSGDLLSDECERPGWTKPNVKHDDKVVAAGDSTTLKRMRKKALYISKSSLTNLEPIGEGQFGTIYKASLQSRGGVSVLVAVKAVKYGSEEASCKFRSEMSIMSQVAHPNIVHLYGLVREVDWMVMEYLPYGDLKMFLTKHKRPVPKLAKYMMEVAMGMHYLSAQGLIHRDLAARNVIVGVDEVCKVSDFGLLRELPKDITVYKATCSHPSPIRWMAPESILKREFSVASDVWSFGIVQWEMFNPTLTPYQELDSVQCAAQVPSGYTMDVPQECPETIHEVMKSCWKMEPSKRPSFVLISSILTNFLITQPYW